MLGAAYTVIRGVLRREPSCLGWLIGREVLLEDIQTGIGVDLGVADAINHQIRSFFAVAMAKIAAQFDAIAEAVALQKVLNHCQVAVIASGKA